MKIISFIFFLSFCANLKAQTSINDSLVHQSQWRSYKVHLPTAYNGSSSMPLVIALHGGGHDADIMENMTKLSLKANVENFIVVYPNGRKFFTRTWNAGTCCGNSVTFNVDDVGFIVKMIDSIKSNYNIDANRIYLTGASNGGMMAYRLACERADIFAAVAPIATTMLTTNPCSPIKRVPILQIHSMPDANVPYNGGFGVGFAGVYMPPIDSVLDIWASINTCNTTRDTIYNSGGAIGLKYQNCNSCNDVIIYKTSDGGHSWPGGNQTATGDPVSTQIDATNIIWDFFESRTLNCLVLGLDPIDDLENQVLIFPNPANDFVEIKSDNQLLLIKSIILFDINGRQIGSYTGQRINTSQLTTGLYFIKIATNKTTVTKKLLIN